MKKTQKKLGNKGFSLVELIVVIAIMAVLVGVLAPTLIKNIEKSRESKDAQNIEQIKSACEVALQDETVYQNTVDTASDKNLVTLSKTTCSVTGGDDFKNELDGIMKVEGTKLTSKKYATRQLHLKLILRDRLAIQKVQQLSNIKSKETLNHAIRITTVLHYLSIRNRIRKFFECTDLQITIKREYSYRTFALYDMWRENPVV